MNHQEEEEQQVAVVWEASPVLGHEWLFIGSLAAAENHGGLQKHKIRRVISVTATKLTHDFLPQDIQHVQVEMDDRPSENLFRVLPICLTNLDQAKQAGENVLVHCSAGISRSVSVVLAWLLVSRHCHTLYHALISVRANRPFANPNPGFMEQLRLLEKCRGNLEQAEKKWNHGAPLACRCTIA